MEDKRFKELIRSKLSKHNYPVDVDMWDKISRSLPAPQVVWYRRLNVRIAIIAAVVFLVTVAGIVHNYVVSYNQLQEDIVSSQYVCEQQDDAEPVQSATDTIPTLLPPSTSPKCAVKQDIGKSLYCASHRCKEVGSTIAPPTAVPSIEAPSTVTPQAEKPVQQHSRPCTDTISEVASTHKEQELPTLYTERIDEDSYFDERVVEDIKKCTHRSCKPLYSFSFEAGTSISCSVVAPVAMRAYQAELKIAHKMPLNTRALIERHFDKWSVGSGLSYSYLTADYEMSCDMRYGRQDLHYVGIPLYASYRFIERNNFSFYFTLGGQVDINTAASHIEDPLSLMYPYIDKKIDFRDEHLQFSAQARVGASYSFTESLSLYLEPVVAYYFANASMLRTMWHDLPWNFSMTFGLRTNF